MTSKGLLPAILGVGFGVLVLALAVVLHRIWRRRKEHSEFSSRKLSGIMGRPKKSKSQIHEDIPEFVIPGTELRLVQPVVVPPSPSSPPQSSFINHPVAQNVGENTNDASLSPRAKRTVTLPLDNKRKLSLQLDGRKHGTDSPIQSGKAVAQRSSSLDLISSGFATTPDSQQIHLASSLTYSSTPPRKKAALSRNPSVGSVELLSINVPPTTRSGPSSCEGSRDSSRQSPEDSPRLLRVFRQSKHQIKLTGAILEFSLQYHLSKRALMLNVMRVRSLFIPTDRKVDAKICLTIHLKPDKYIWEAKTKIVKGTENPTFGELFAINGFSLTKLHECALLFRLEDLNVNQTIGEVTFFLRDLQPDVLTSRSCQLQRPISATKDRDRSYVGDLLVSMDYNPTDWKLNIRIIRARGLPKMSRRGHTDAFVKVNVMRDLTRVFKRKTRVQHHEWNPEFDEGFDFELTRDQMESTSITLKVVHRGKIRDHLIGVVLMGFNIDPMETGYQHWAMILDKPNLSIEQWHKIYPVLK